VLKPRKTIIDYTYDFGEGREHRLTVTGVRAASPASKGRGIAAFHADNGSAAEARARDRFFRDELMVLSTDGLLLWDGVTALRVRQALPVEEVKWRASRARAIRQGNIGSNDDAWIAFLVALTDRDR
jgi:hypothetical protein